MGATTRLVCAIGMVIAATAQADDSAMDASFGTDLGAGGGQVGIAFDLGGANQDVGFALKVSAGKYFVAAGASNAAVPAAAVFARLQDNGTLDTGYGTGGKIATAVGANAAALDAQGRWLVISGFSLVRFNADGNKDMQFGTGGSAALNFNAGALALDASGRIVVAGTDVADPSFAQYMAVTRLQPNGMPDGTFNGSPATCGTGVDVSGTSIFHASGLAVAIAGDGTIVVSGNDVAAASATPSAALGIFGTDGTGNVGCGLVIVGNAGTNARATGVAVDASNRAVVTGYEEVGSTPRTFVSRVILNGLASHVDASFGAGQGGAAVGETFIDVPDLLGATPNSLAIRSDGKIVVAGTVGNDMLIARLDVNGALDSAFAAGHAYRHIAFTSGASSASAVVLDAGRPVLVGSVFGNSGNQDVAVVRLQSDSIFTGRFGD